jgi:Icc protein
MLIAQLSDPHLKAADEPDLALAESDRMFGRAIARLNALDPRPDVVLLTGDLACSGAPAEYDHLAALLGPLEIPALAIPGNRDDRERFRTVFAHHPHMPADGPIHFVADGFGPVRIVAFDITVPGKYRGQITEEGVAWLEGVLAAEPERPTLIMMHQPPFPSGVPYLDAFLAHGGPHCREGARLAELVARHPCVERIVCGHIHRYLNLRFGGTSLCTAPATMSTRKDPPAFLLHRWQPRRGLFTEELPVIA